MRRRCLLPVATFVATFVVVVDGAACAGDEGCELAFVVDAVDCPVDDCVIDFGSVQTSLTESRRLSWTGACGVDEFIERPTVVEGADVFRVGQVGEFLGDGDQGFVFVSATPVDAEPTRGTLSLGQRSVGLRVNIEP
jgi:hypothetical protein